MGRLIPKDLFSCSKFISEHAYREQASIAFRAVLVTSKPNHATTGTIYLSDTTYILRTNIPQIAHAYAMILKVLVLDIFNKIINKVHQTYYRSVDLSLCPNRLAWFHAFIIHINPGPCRGGGELW